MICWHCNGGGLVGSGWSCSFCNGTGRVDRSTELSVKVSELEAKLTTVSQELEDYKALFKKVCDKYDLDDYGNSFGN